jgi:hypothetical protein
VLEGSTNSEGRYKGTEGSYSVRRLVPLQHPIKRRRHQTFHSR